tara:strand:- start:249 stop:455 length:207 start_codon:yes stop_codon:yes gene_type:complete
LAILKVVLFQDLNLLIEKLKGSKVEILPLDQGAEIFWEVVPKSVQLGFLQRQQDLRYLDRNEPAQGQD